MKDGTAYGARLKKAFAKLRQSVGKPIIPEPDDPLRRLAVAILGVGSSDAEAVKATDRALANMVDWNEIRISTAEQVHEAIGNGIAPGAQHCRRLITALQGIYNIENCLSLDRLKNMPRRDAKQYLEALPGVDEYAVASVMLWSLGGHAIPVNDRLLEGLRSANLVYPQADRGEVQAFLERHVNAADAKEFCLVIQSLARGKRAPVPRAKSERSSRNKKKQRRAP